MAFSLNNKKILIIDDQRPFQIMLKGILMGLGADVISLVSSGESALKLCKTETFDYFFIDYNLGSDRRNGRQLLEELKKRRLMNADSIFFMVTGESNRPMVLGAIENQPDDYLMKPFSQNVLKRRLEKAYEKKQIHKQIFKYLMKDKIDEAITECEASLSFPNRYTNYGKRLLAELYCRVKKLDEAERLLLDELEQKRQAWCVLQLAHVYFLKENYQKTITLIGEVIIESPLMVQAYDILAQSQLALKLKEQSLATAKKAIELSPYSIQRQQLVCQIARECGDFDLVQACCNSIWLMSRRSVYHNTNFLLNYIRASIEAAERAESKQLSNKFQQEASLALQRGKAESNQMPDFDYDTFSAICNARIEVISGQLLLAKKQLYACHQDSNVNLEDLDASLYPDIYTVLSKIGEYDEADDIYSKLDLSQKDNSFLTSSLTSIFQETEDKKQIFQELHEKGIEHYKQGQYKQASDVFDNALKTAPMNTGTALNLIQSILKLLEDKNSKNLEYIQLLNKTKRILEGVRLPAKHRERYQELKQQIQNIQ